MLNQFQGSSSPLIPDFSPSCGPYRLNLFSWPARARSNYLFQRRKGHDLRRFATRCEVLQESAMKTLESISEKLLGRTAYQPLIPRHEDGRLLTTATLLRRHVVRTENRELDSVRRKPRDIRLGELRENLEHLRGRLSVSGSFSAGWPGVLDISAIRLSPLLASSRHAFSSAQRLPLDSDVQAKSGRQRDPWHPVLSFGSIGLTL